MRELDRAIVLKAAIARWGKHVVIREARKAPSAAERATALARYKEIADLIREVEEAMKSLGNTQSRLVSAARFALDVDGDEPSWAQLREAVEAAEHLDRLVDERKDLRREAEHLDGYTKRWTVLDNIGIANMVKADADTLEELAAAIGA